MIRLTCAHCQATLEVDDAFAGGVCRCQHCKTIQTVPRPGGRPNTPGADTNQPKALYQVKSRAGSSSTPSGLEELAEVVQSSGMSGSGLFDPAGRVPTATPAKRSTKSAVLIGAISGALLAIGVSVAAVLLLQNRTAAPSANGPLAAPTVEAAGPMFAGTPLTGGKVIFLLDRGDATSQFFPALRQLTLRAVKSLGPDKKFQVILWDNGASDAYPTLSAGYATAAELEKLSRWFDGVSVGRSSDVIPSLKLAMAQTPDTIVLATAKSSQLDDAFATDFLAIRGTNHPTIDAFTLGDSSADDPLKNIAAATNGKFAILSTSELNSAVQP